MDEKMSKYQSLLIAVIAVMAVIWACYTYVYKPKLSEINSLVNSLKLIDSEIKMIDGGDMLLRDLPKAKDLIKGQLNSLSQKIPSEADTPYLINNFISVVGKGLKIDYNLIQPGVLGPEKQYMRLPIQIEFEGDYANLNAYLDQLKKLPVTIRVDSLNLNKMSDSNKLAVKMTLSAFFMPGGQGRPDEKLAEFKRLYDPFYVPTSSGSTKKELIIEKAPDLKYTGFVISKGIKAIINDEMVMTGSIVKGFKVYKIYKDRVVLVKNKKLFELPLERTK
jgi:Tfp pilus assembly protein PilO